MALIQKIKESWDDFWTEIESMTEEQKEAFNESTNRLG